MAVLLAQMWNGGGDHMDNGWWWVMGIGFLILIAVLVGAVVILVSRHNRPGPSTSGGRGPQDILADRFARGEMDEDEYRRRRDAIRE